MSAGSPLIATLLCGAPAPSNGLVVRRDNSRDCRDAWGGPGEAWGGPGEARGGWSTTGEWRLARWLLDNCNKPLQGGKGLALDALKESKARVG